MPHARCAQTRRQREQRQSLAILRTGFTTAAMALGLMGCVTKREIAPIPPSLLGDWHTATTGDLMQFAPGGIFVLEVKGEDPHVGRCAVDGSRLTVRYQLGSATCAEEPGQYTFTIAGDSLTLADPGETCVDRLRVLSQTWTRRTP